MKKKIVTHNAKFHTDDVFGVAALFLLLGKENCELVRTRDEEVIASGDYVLDVGTIYDEKTNRFDHHQAGGAGERENGIPYASVGLVWKKFGVDICGSKSISDALDDYLISQIDAGDNGVSLFSPRILGQSPFDASSFVNQFRLTWKEGGEWDEKFLLAVDWAIKVLEREIKILKDAEEAERTILEIYEQSSNKNLIVLDEKHDFGREIVNSVLVNFNEPVYAILYRGDTNSWQVLSIRKSKGTFESRKPLPESWRAKLNREFEEASGVSGALFCHRSGFMCTASSKEAALALAKLALDS